MIKETPSIEFYQAHHDSLLKEAERMGLIDFDPLVACDGMQWLKGIINSGEAATLEDVRLAFEKADGDRGAWAAGILRFQIDDLYPEFRRTMLDALNGDNRTAVLMCARHKLTEDEKKELS